jgi:hypothetical protein
MLQTVLGLRVVLTLALVLCLAFISSFLALTLLGRRFLSGLSPGESLLGRLAAAAVLALLVMGGAGSVALTVLVAGGASAPVFTLPSQLDAARLQTIVGVVIALALSVLATVRIEIRHREATGTAGRPHTEAEEEGDWIQEPRGG